jgi:hypothetical protein
MKNVIVLTMALLFLILSTSSFASDNNYEGSFRSKMMAYNEMKKPWTVELEKNRAYLLKEKEKYGYNFALMNAETLDGFIEQQKDYLEIKEFLINQLAQIYFQKEKNNFKVEDSKLDAALGHKCSVWEKIAYLCEKNQKALVYEAQYLNQKISEMDTLESSLTYAVAELIVEEDKNIARVTMPKNSFPKNLKLKMN